MEVQHSPLFLTVREPSFPHQRARTARFPTEGKKAITSYSVGITRSPVPSRYTKAQIFTLLLLEERHISPVQELESQLLHQVTICYSAGESRPMPHSAQRPSAPQCNCRRAPAPPSKTGENR
jgi:hypothetical protein